MLPKIAAASASILIGVSLLVMPSPGHAQNPPTARPQPWPIQNWHQLQPRADQLSATHTDDLTPQDARKVEQLYWELEGQTLKGTENCESKSIPPLERDQCRSERGARVLPSRPVPVIMAPSR
jgi:hypothetical protein